EENRAVGIKVVEVVFKGLTGQHIILCQTQGSGCHSRIADRVHRNDRVELLLRSPDETSRFIGHEMDFRLVVEIAPEVVHAIRDDVVNGRIDVDRGDGAGMMLESGKYLVSGSRANNQNLRTGFLNVSNGRLLFNLI